MQAVCISKFQTLRDSDMRMNVDRGMYSVRLHRRCVSPYDPTVRSAHMLTPYTSRTGLFKSPQHSSYRNNSTQLDERIDEEINALSCFHFLRTSPFPQLFLSLPDPHLQPSSFTTYGTHVLCISWRPVARSTSRKQSDWPKHL